jgi:hypothetical protein
VLVGREGGSAENERLVAIGAAFPLLATAALAAASAVTALATVAPLLAVIGFTILLFSADPPPVPAPPTNDTGAVAFFDTSNNILHELEIVLQQHQAEVGASTLASLITDIETEM